MQIDRARLKRWLFHDSYVVVGWLLFLILIVYGWRGFVRQHEAIYMLGARRIFDPDFLTADLGWRSPRPTSFLFDHLLAPLWGFLEDFGIASLGRLVVWFFTAWSLAALARAMRLPPWSMVAGVTLWLLWRQTFTACGDPIEGFQPKSLAYPLIFFSLALAIRGKAIPAGVAAGAGTALHIIVGGWACLALFLTLLANRTLFSLREVGMFLLATVPFVAPLVLVVGLYHSGGVTGDEQALMDKTYVTFAQPHCCDPSYFMTSSRWARAAVILPLAPTLFLLWPQRRGARVMASFTLVLGALFVLGLLAGELELYGFLKLFPFQLAAGLTPLFLLVMCLALAGPGRPEGVSGKLVWVASIIAVLWMLSDRKVGSARFIRVASRFAASLEPVRDGKFEKRVSRDELEVYSWIRETTPQRSVFITPYLEAFWTYAEREQVAAFRHPPLDEGLIEWKERLEALNGFKPFKARGYRSMRELDRNQPRLTIEDLIRIRDTYGATHYLTVGNRRDLAKNTLYAGPTYHVYDVESLRSRSAPRPVSR